LLPNLFLLSTSRHPPLSHLFPYTTLFRSALWRRLSTAPRAPKARRSQHSNIALSATRRQSMPLRKQTAQAAERARHFATGSARQDRKSTRLNSSHVKISYAVFCLKKKIKR